MTTNTTPGLVISDDGVRYARLADDSTVPTSNATDEDTFPWWSFTKCVIATCALVLVSRGRLELDEPLRGHRFTLRQLLQHRAGVPNYGGLAEYHAAVARGDEPWPERRLLDAVDVDHAVFAPGEGWAYSNVGYLFARRFVEESLGLEFGRAVEELLCQPLALTTVRVARTPEDLGTTVWGNRHGYHPGWVYHGLLIGSAGDACRLLRAVLDGPLLPDELRGEMRRLLPLGHEIPGRPWTSFGYGLGLMGGTMIDVGAAAGHSGVGPRDACAIYRFSEASTPCTVAVFDQAISEDRVEREAVRIALEPALRG